MPNLDHLLRSLRDSGFRSIVQDELGTTVDLSNYGPALVEYAHRIANEKGFELVDTGVGNFLIEEAPLADDVDEIPAADIALTEQAAEDAVLEAQIANDNAADDMPQTPAELVASINRDLLGWVLADQRALDAATPAGPALPGVIWTVGTSRSITVEDISAHEVQPGDRLTQINEVPIGIQDPANGDAGVLIEGWAHITGGDYSLTVWMGKSMVEIFVEVTDVIQVVRR